MKTVLWISRHLMTGPQLEDLEHCLDDQVSVIQYGSTVNDVMELVPFLDCVDIVAAVLPINLLAQLVKHTNKPVLQAKAQRIPTGNIITLADGRKEQEFQFVHSYWEQVLTVEVTTRKLT